MRRILFVAAALVAAASGTHAQGSARAGGLELSFLRGGEFSARVAMDPGLARGAALYLYDGKGKQPVALDARPAAGSAWELAARDGFPLKGTLKLAPAGRCLVWEVSCANTGREQQWLEVGPRMVLNGASVTHFFDGWDDYEAPKAKTSSERLEGNMPLAVAWNAAACVAVGLEPSQLVSYLRQEYEPLADGSARLAAIARIVVDPGKTETVKFVLCATPGEWGKYEAFEAYYDSFPEWFHPRKDVDPRTHLGSAQYRAWPAGPWAPEICRRLYGGWDWCYAPFRRTGDIVGRAELWDYEPVRPFGKTRGKPREEYLAWRKEAFTAGARRAGVAMMFYIPAQIWCEERLARERYADALTTDPKAKTYFDTPWVTGNDNELRVFPYKTSFGEQSYRDMRQVAEELDLSGFAFDTAGDATRYTGPALPNLDARAWDDQVGVYCAEMVAITHLMDFVHTLKKDGRPLSVVSNPMSNGTYASCFHSDSAMLEGSPWQRGRTDGDHLRWKMGRKTLVWWEGYEIGDFVDLESVKPDQLARVYEGLADFTLLQSLRIGYIPTPNFTQGVGRLVRWLPAIVECVQTGWEPVPATRVPEPLWVTRYGRGLKTLLAIAHETGEPVRGEARILHQRMGGNALLFSHYDGRALTNRVAKGETVVPVNVPVRTPWLLRAQIEVVNASTVRSAEVRETTSATGSRLEATLTGAGETALRIRVPAGMRLVALRVDGRPVQARPEGDGVVARAKLGANTRLAAQFASNLLDIQERALLDYPFVKDGKPACAIVVPKGAGERERLAAFRIQEYFRYWYGRVQEPATEVLLPIRESDAPGSGPLVRLSIAAGKKPRVSLQGRDLVVEASSAEELEESVFAVLRALDRKYWSPDWHGQAAVRARLASYGKDG